MTESDTKSQVVHLRAADTSVIVASNDDGPPQILHWGVDLGDLSEDDLLALVRAGRQPIGDSVVNTASPAAVVPQLADGWLGMPGLQCHRGGLAWAPRFVTAGWHPSDRRLQVLLVDENLELEQDLLFELEPSGLLRIRATLTNIAPESLEVQSLVLSVPVPATAHELMDFSGGWANERHPQRMPFNVGRWTREARGGKPGLDGPLLMIAGAPGFDFLGGDVRAIHLAWSGNQQLAAERTFTDSRRLIAGELLLPGELTLAQGDSYATPWLYASWGSGLNELAARFHAHLRAKHPQYEPVPVLLNTWEATYFDQSFSTFEALARSAAKVGAELFVVDDGWFRGRNNDHTSLGDWFVDETKWPDGLKPLSDLVHDLGLAFGLWVEPEMVSLESDLARLHPDWLFDAGRGPGLPSRYQHVLDLGNPQAFAWIQTRLNSLIDEIGIDYLKWDHNRYLLDAGQHRAQGRAGVHDQTLACLALMSQLKAAHPGLRIESCASGGGRIDFGVLDVTDRVWPSDTNDPHERLRIQRWTGLLLPPEYQGTHIGAARAHTTGRNSDLDFRAQVAIWGNLGLELDIARLDAPERSSLATWIAFHKRWREHLHTGTTIVVDRSDNSFLTGVVAPDQRTALFLFAVCELSHTSPATLRFAGLDPEFSYSVQIEPAPPEETLPWAHGPAICLPGAVLMNVGVTAPNLRPDSATIISLTQQRCRTAELATGM